MEEDRKAVEKIVNHKGIITRSFMQEIDKNAFQGGKKGKSMTRKQTFLMLKMKELNIPQKGDRLSINFSDTETNNLDLELKLRLAMK